VYMHDLIETDGLGPGDAETLRDRVHGIVSRPVDEHLRGSPASAAPQAYFEVDGREEIQRKAEPQRAYASQMDGVRG